MNEQSGAKKILFNKSTLFSLKAELLKKQEEVYEKKQLPQNRLENFKPPAKVKDDEKNNKEPKKTFRDSLKAIDTEELEACRKSKLALQKKSELYEHLSDKAGSSQLAGRFLVDFNSKKKQEESVSDVENEDVQIPENNVGEDEWVEFTDCLGRTRKCHKSDLEMYMKKDKELMTVINRDSTTNEKPDDNQAVEDSNKEPEKPILVQKTNDYLQSLRKKWDEKEQELLAKDKDIHYQDILFDEARIHGVGYYAFSTDETERQAQMEQLKKRREETLRKQEEAEKMRRERDALMAARVTAARQRQRARQGLPPLPDHEQQQPQKDFSTCLLEFLTQQRNEADAKANEAEIKQKEEQEKERQKLRESYVREWDIGKEGVVGNEKKFREITQEEYVEQQRAKRIDEFAPPQTSTSRRTKNTNIFFDDRGTQVTPESAIQNKTWSDVRPVADPMVSDICSISEVPEKKGLYFTSKKDVKFKNFVKITEPTLIVNEVSDEEEETNERIDKRKLDKSGVEIEPPATYEYYGPTPKKTKPQNPYKIDVREAYAQGAKSLECKSSDIKLPQHYDFTFD